VVQGSATDSANGAWSVKEVAPGKVVFVANQTTKLTSALVIDGFVVTGTENSVDRPIDYASQGHWIGQTGTVSGPALTNLPWLFLLLSD
jgi:hypothetical protein